MKRLFFVVSLLILTFSKEEEEFLLDWERIDLMNCLLLVGN
jgi:hypothetical protein